jgi:hypothetical protein
MIDRRVIRRSTTEYTESTKGMRGDGIPCRLTDDPPEGRARRRCRPVRIAPPATTISHRRHVTGFFRGEERRRISPGGSMTTITPEQRIAAAEAGDAPAAARPTARNGNGPHGVSVRA